MVEGDQSPNLTVFQYRDIDEAKQFLRKKLEELGKKYDR